MTDLRRASGDVGPFLSLCNDPDDYEMALDRLQHIIWWSFRWLDHQVGTITEITDTEIRRRFLICEKWFRIFRQELGYGLQQALDTLPKALASDLLGLQFDPPRVADRGWGRGPNDLIKRVSNATRKS